MADEEVVLPVGRDSVQGAVELSVAAAVEPVASVFTGARFEWCEAGGAGKLGWVRDVTGRPGRLCRGGPMTAVAYPDRQA